MGKKIKLELTKSQEDFLMDEGKNINGKYFYFPKFYIRVEDRIYEEVDFKDLPKGIQEYINKNK